jgi:hypothetical protein
MSDGSSIYKMILLNGFQQSYVDGPSTEKILIIQVVGDCCRQATQRRSRVLLP